MIDSVLKGNGNSRFLKSAVPAGTSWADALAMLQAGTFPIDFNGINTEGFQQVGTPLNKVNLLKDATAAQIGLPPSTTPDGMFQALGNTGELHVWKKTIASGTGTYSLGAVQEGLHYIKWANYATSDSSVGTLEYGSEVSVNNDGTITGIKNPSTITIKPWYDDVSKANVFKGKFIKMISQVETSMSSFKIGEIWWIPADATMTTGLVNGEGNTRYIAASKRQQVIGVPAGTTTTYPVSTNPNAYQEGDDAKEAGYTVGEVIKSTGAYGFFGMMGFAYGTSYFQKISDAIEVADDGSVSHVAPVDDISDSTVLDSASVLKERIAGKYITLSENSYTKQPYTNELPPTNTVLYIPADVNVKMIHPEGASLSNQYALFFDRYQPVTGYAAIPAGTTIEYLGKLGDKARVQVVSYVGTGTYGADNPNSLTFDFVPKVVMFIDYVYTDGTNRGNHYIDNYSKIYYEMSRLSTEKLTGAYTQNNGLGGYGPQLYGKKTNGGKTITWYSQSGSDYQANSAGYIYTYLGIG